MHYSQLQKILIMASALKLRKQSLTLLLVFIAVFSSVLWAGSGKPTPSSPSLQMACNDLVHVSLDDRCFATITPATVLQDMQGLASDYRIEVTYNGVVRPNLNFGSNDINKYFDYKIWYLPNGNSCWGRIKIEDKYPPQMVCTPDTIRCTDSFHPGFLGFPIPASFTTVYMDTVAWDTTGGFRIPVRFQVYNWDACGVVNLSFHDRIDYYGCDSLCFKKLFREWVAVDLAGNTSRCTDTTCVLRPDARDIQYPRHYDGFDLPYLKCDANFPKLPGGNPSPEFTGHPIPNGCNTIVASYSDLKIVVCEKTFKVIRRWQIVDWCSRENFEYSQLIKVVDDEAPEFDLPEDYTVGMTPWSCGSFGKILPPFNVTDCSSWTYDVFVKLPDPVTGDPGPKLKQFISFNKQDKCFYLDGAPEGRIWVVYVLSDACGNESEDYIEIGVVDDQLPVAVCDQSTVVTLTSDDTAKILAATFDDGSIDNCGIGGFQVRRMSDTCKTGTDVFGPYVQFCCLDVGKVIMVALEVTDTYGNSNTCMVEVVVQEKEPPVLIPPTDVTISCGFNRGDLSVFGKIAYDQQDREQIIIRDYYYAGSSYVAGVDGYAYDNCHVTVTETVRDSIVCNQGKIWRTFTAVDNQGLSTTRTQVIHIFNPDPFDSTDIIWPLEHVRIESCRAADTHPDKTGAPTFTNTQCANVTMNYADTRLTVLDSICYKILRKWTVLEWCQYEPRSQKGLWEFTQVIYVYNQTPPDLYTCQELLFCDDRAYTDSTTGQCMAHYDMTGDGEDDCTYPQDLLWSYRLDENNDGTFGPVVKGNRATGVLPVGVHRIRWTLEDQCGNISQCDQVFTLKDCKKPTPYCLPGVNTVIMPTTGRVAVWAKDLDLGSFDNCTPKNRLKFSFSSDTSVTSITYDCDSLDKQQFIVKQVRIYVTDEEGNQDYCETTIRIQDNNQACGGSLTGVGGNLKRPDGTAIPESVIHVFDPTGQEITTIESDQSGNYAFATLPSEKTSYFSVTREDLASSGVSTMDIIMVQKHILGQKFLNNAYEILAADVNRSNSVTARDIADIRKVILGMTEKYSSDRVWLFVPASQTFTNPTAPWQFREIITKEEVNGQLSRINFTGIKLGDVDQSARLNLNQDISSRSISQSDLIMVQDGKSNRWSVSASHHMELEGMQWSLVLLTDQAVNISSAAIELGDHNYHQIDLGEGRSEIRFSWTSEKPQTIGKDEVLFYIEMPEGVSLAGAILRSEGGLHNEAYLSQGNMMGLRFRADGQKGQAQAGFDLGQNQPNPFAGKTLIQVRSSQSFHGMFTVMDATGKVLIRRYVAFQEGQNQLEIDRLELNGAGMYLYRLEGLGQSQVRKMIVNN